MNGTPGTSTAPSTSRSASWRRAWARSRATARWSPSAGAGAAATGRPAASARPDSRPRTWTAGSPPGAARAFRWSVRPAVRAASSRVAAPATDSPPYLTKEWLAAHLGEERREADLLSEVREAIFGAQDGVTSILVVVITVATATNQRYAVLVAGIAAALAEILSMAAGEYMSSKSQREIFLAQIAKERQEVAERPGESEAEVAYMLEQEGLSEPAARCTRTRTRTQRWRASATAMAHAGHMGEGWPRSEHSPEHGGPNAKSLEETIPPVADPLEAGMGPGEELTAQEAKAVREQPGR